MALAQVYRQLNRDQDRDQEIICKLLLLNNAPRNFHVLTIPDQMCGQTWPKSPLSEKQMTLLDSMVNLMQNNSSDLHVSLLLYIFPFFDHS